MIILFVLTIVVLFGVIFFQSKKAKRERENNENQLASLQKEIDSLKKLQSFYADIEEDSAKLNDDIEISHYESLVESASQQIERDLEGDDKTSEMDLLDEEQSKVLHEMLSSDSNFFITGKAGTGKSFLLEVYKRVAKKKFLVLAPTGIAALNVNGVTIHSAFGYYNLENLSVDGINAQSIRLKDERRMTLKSSSVIIIDEISMVRADTLEKINRILQVSSGNDLPFGGKQVLLFGDLYQLPPIVKKEELKYLKERFGGKYFFYSDCYKNGNFKFIELTVNHRHEDDKLFFELLNRVRDGSVLAQDIELLKTRKLKDISVYDRFTTIVPKKAEAEKINSDHLDRLPSPEYIYDLQVIKDKYPDRKHNWEALFPVRYQLKLRKGALVMMVSNDPQQRWVNGTLGIIKNLTENTIHISINGQTYEVHPEYFTEREAVYVEAMDEIQYEEILKVSQYPVILAYAMTIHKSQGQTYRNIICDIERCFDDGQAYVALSRCSSLDGLHIQGDVNKASIHVDQEVVQFYRLQLNSII